MMTHSADFASLFELSPGAYLVLDTDLKLIIASEEYQKMTGIDSSAYGKSIAEVFPPPNTKTGKAEAEAVDFALNSVKETLEPSVLPTIRYDIKLTDDTYEIRYWKSVNTPLLDKEGNLEYILQKVVDVTNETAFENTQARITNLFESFKKRVTIALTIVAIGCSVALFQVFDTIHFNKGSIDKIKADATARQDDVCTIFERSENVAVKEIKDTYRYLDGLKPQDIKSGLNQFVISNYPSTYAVAKVTVAPKFCDQKGIGLTEASPILPKRRNYSNLLK